MKRVLHSCTALALTFALTAPAFAQEALKEIGPGEGEVSIVAWAGYIERGETDKLLAAAEREARRLRRAKQFWG